MVTVTFYSYNTASAVKIDDTPPENDPYSPTLPSWRCKEGVSIGGYVLLLR